MLAVGVVIGGAFSAIVNAFVNMLMSLATWPVPGGPADYQFLFIILTHIGEGLLILLHPLGDLQEDVCGEVILTLGDGVELTVGFEDEVTIRTQGNAGQSIVLFSLVGERRSGDAGVLTLADVDVGGADAGHHILNDGDGRVADFRELGEEVLSVHVFILLLVSFSITKIQQFFEFTKFFFTFLVRYRSRRSLEMSFL